MRFFIIRTLPEATQWSVAELGQQAQLPFTLEPRAGSARSQPLVPCPFYFPPANFGSCERWAIKAAHVFPSCRNICIPSLWNWWSNRTTSAVVRLPVVRSRLHQSISLPALESIYSSVKLRHWLFWAVPMIQWPRALTQSQVHSHHPVAQTCPTLGDFMDYSSAGSPVHGILQARILEWVAMPSSRGSSRSRDRTQVSHIGR